VHILGLLLCVRARPRPAAQARRRRRYRSSNRRQPTKPTAAAATTATTTTTTPKRATEQFVDSMLEAQLQHVLPTQEEKDTGTLCLIAIREIVIKSLPGEHERWEVAPFGSFVNGFGIRDCDLDAVIFNRNTKALFPTEAKEMANTLLQTLRDAILQRDDFVKEATLIPNARVPILKIKFKGPPGHKVSRPLEVDLSVNNMAPLKNTRLLKAYASLHPYVPYLGIAIKNWAKDLEVSGAANGFLSSYAFVILTLYYLQAAWGLPTLPSDEDALEQAIQRRPVWQPSATLDELYYGFFHFYGGRFAWYTELVCLDWRNADRLQHTGRICIQDPIELTRNLADVLSEPNEHYLYEMICYSVMYPPDLTALPFGYLPDTINGDAENGFETSSFDTSITDGEALTNPAPPTPPAPPTRSQSELLGSRSLILQGREGSELTGAAAAAAEAAATTKPSPEQAGRGAQHAENAHWMGTAEGQHPETAYGVGAAAAPAPAAPAPATPAPAAPAPAAGAAAAAAAPPPRLPPLPYSFSLGSFPPWRSCRL